MTTISDRDRAEVQAIAEAFYHGRTLPAMGDSSVRRWLAVRDHVLASHTCESAWRPTTREEIQAGWEVRSRRYGGKEATWGIAHHQDIHGNWRTKEEIMLTTFANLEWTYETTAPLPEPEPWDEALVGVVSDALAEGPGYHRDDDARRVLDALAARGYLDRAAITGGGQS